MNVTNIDSTSRATPTERGCASDDGESAAYQYIGRLSR